jgi:hypothetical protein
MKNASNNTKTTTVTGPARRLEQALAIIADTYELGLDEQSIQNIAAEGFQTKTLALALVAADILVNEQPITLRGLMYRVVSAGWLPSTDQKHYKQLGRIMTQLREHGIVSFDWIVDGIRTTDKPNSWSGLADFADTVRSAYRLDFWARLPHYVHFIVEKDAIAGTLSPVTNEYDVSLSPIRGYSSLSFLHDIAESWSQIQKPVFCYYLGDFDPSGFDLERDVREKLARYCAGKNLFVADDLIEEGWLESADQTCIVFNRLGVLEPDFSDFDLLPLDVKDSDTRACKFRIAHGDRCAELDAIPSTELRQRVSRVIDSHIDIRRDEWTRLQTIEDSERETLSKFIDGMKGH